MTTPAQPAILQPQRTHARYLTAHHRVEVPVDEIRQSLASLEIDDRLVVGLGPGLANLLGIQREELRPFPAISGVGVEVPSTQADLWLWVNSDDRGSAIVGARELSLRLEPCWTVSEPVDGFKHGQTESGLGRDLTGYEDGTENPEGNDAISAALSSDGSSFVAVQSWKHDLNRFASFTQSQQDNLIGRRRSDNEELEDAPESAHVKRTAQEDFAPEAFVLRRSLPWFGPDGEGLMFVAFGKSFDAYEAQMRRMAGLDDGILDGCFQFSSPTTGGYYWCPPVVDGHLLLE